MKALKLMIPILVFVAMGIGALYWLKNKQVNIGSGGAQTAGMVTLGGPVPKVVLTELSDAGTSTQVKTLKHKVVLVNFWATWCEACMVEMPSIVNLRETYKDKGFEVLGVNLDEEPQTSVPRVIKELGLSFPIFIDQDGEASALFGVHAIPFTVIMDLKKDKVLYMQSGERDWNSSEMKTQLEAWLAE